MAMMQTDDIKNDDSSDKFDDMIAVLGKKSENTMMNFPQLFSMVTSVIQHTNSSPSSIVTELDTLLPKVQEEQDFWKQILTNKEILKLLSQYSNGKQRIQNALSLHRQFRSILHDIKPIIAKLQFINRYRLKLSEQLKKHIETINILQDSSDYGSEVNTSKIKLQTKKIRIQFKLLTKTMEIEPLSENKENDNNSKLDDLAKKLDDFVTQIDKENVEWNLFDAENSIKEKINQLTKVDDKGFKFFDGMLQAGITCGAVIALAAVATGGIGLLAGASVAFLKVCCVVGAVGAAVEITSGVADIGLRKWHTHKISKKYKANKDKIEYYNKLQRKVGLVQRSLNKIAKDAKAIDKMIVDMCISREKQKGQVNQVDAEAADDEVIECFLDSSLDEIITELVNFDNQCKECIKTIDNAWNSMIM